MNTALRVEVVERIREDLSRMATIASEQLDSSVWAFSYLDTDRASAVIEKDDLVDNLYLRVEANAFELVTFAGRSEAENRLARSAVKVASNLEHIADAATHIAKRVRIMARDGIGPEKAADIAKLPYIELSRLAQQALHESVRAYLHEDVTMAKRACEREPELDRVFVDGVKQLAEFIKAAPEAAVFHLHLLPVLKYLERVGDYVLNIGEQAIYVATGRRLKFAQFQQLDALLGTPEEACYFTAYRDGISGAIVARVGEGTPVVFKEGARRKIEEEVAKTSEWQKIDERLTPKVLSTVTFDDRQAFVREYVDGVLFSHIYFESGDPILQLAVTDRLCETARRIWTQTKVVQSPKLDYLAQIRQRLDEVYSFHPELRHLATSPAVYRRQEVPPLEEQLRRLQVVEPSLAPSFCIWLHGDFNSNNVVFNPKDESLKLIDVHRSRHGDYLQDATVFLVGLEREPSLSPTTRRQLRKVSAQFLEFVKSFATENEDVLWEKRLLLGLGRSYITSARLVLNPSHAEWLFRRGRQSLQELLLNV
jgi:phosphate uptake regulator